MKTLQQSDLQRFQGTKNFYTHGIGNLKIHLTDGAKHVCEAYWLADLVLSYQIHKKVMQEPMKVWTLKKREKDWLVTCNEGNGKLLAKQVIEYSDFPLDSIQLYLIDKVLLLPSEY